MIINPTLPSGHVIFCDDIRQEMNGKVTFVGAYSNFLFVNGTLPVVLPKLCMGIVYREETDSLQPVKVKVFLPSDDEDSPTATMAFEPQADMIPPPSEEFLFREARLLFELPGAVIAQEGRVRVRAYRGDDEIRLGSLTVALNPTLTEAQPPTTDEQEASQTA